MLIKAVFFPQGPRVVFLHPKKNPPRSSTVSLGEATGSCTCGSGGGKGRFIKGNQWAFFLWGGVRYAEGETSRLTIAINKSQKKTKGFSWICESPSTFKKLVGCSFQPIVYLWFSLLIHGFHPKVQNHQKSPTEKMTQHKKSHQFLDGKTPFLGFFFALGGKSWRLTDSWSPPLGFLSSPRVSWPTCRAEAGVLGAATWPEHRGVGGGEGKFRNRNPQKRTPRHLEDHPI